jgi:quercetin dioxygenase-like cupin family protein
MTDGASSDTAESKETRFAIFRARDGRSFSEVSAMYAEPAAPANLEGWPKVQAAGYNEGHETKLLFSAPGFSLTYVWFKSGLPLPRHSHNVDCLYYIIAGSLRLGTQQLGPGDGFFIGADAPYAYVPGEQGVEVLEYRAADRFSIKFRADNLEFWTRAAEEIRRRRETWASEVRPSLAT